MKYVYAISQTNETTKQCNYQAINLFETEELATEYLHKWEDEIKRGLWDSYGACTFLEWHDADDEEVTWMRFSRKDFNGVENVICFCVEAMPVIAEL